MILYPTETLYALGVNALSEVEIDNLYAVKIRPRDKAVTWLVRDVADIRAYAEMSETAVKIAKQFLPGPLTLVLPALAQVQKEFISEDGTIGFRISADAQAQVVISEFMKKHNTPLTCTSANISGLPTLATPEEIIQQFTEHNPTFAGFSQVIGDGVRTGTVSTIVRVVNEEITIIRSGQISEETILSALL